MAIEIEKLPLNYLPFTALNNQMIFLLGRDAKYCVFTSFGDGNWRADQTRGMYGLRRDGKNKASVKTHAAATGANIALVIGLFKLCWFILAVFLLFF